MRVDVRLPLPDEQVFRYGAMDDILEIAARNPSTEFSNRDFQRLTGYGGPSISKALSLLQTLELLVKRETSTKTLYRINEQRLRNADDPLLEIPQREFRKPLTRFVERIDDELDAVGGIVCFGSVARGDADRMSDIDVFLLVADDTELVAARRTVSDVVRDLEDEPIDGQRYEFEVFTESPESARRRGDELQRIFQEGVPLVERDSLRQLRRDLFGGDTE